MTKQKPPVFNVDCYGIDFDTYQFLLDDIAQGIEDGNRMYGFGEPGYIGADGNFCPYPLPDNDNDKPRQTQTLSLIVKPKSKRKRERRRIGPSIEQVAVARGIIRAIRHHHYSIPKEASY
jgi:hypothetical protein